MSFRATALAKYIPGTIFFVLPYGAGTFPMSSYVPALSFEQTMGGQCRHNPAFSLSKIASLIARDKGIVDSLFPLNIEALTLRNQFPSPADPC